MLFPVLLVACGGGPDPSGTSSSETGDPGGPSGATGETGAPIVSPAPIAPGTPGDVAPFADLTVPVVGMDFLPFDLAVADDGDLCVAGWGFPDDSADLHVGVLLRISGGAPDPVHGTGGFAVDAEAGGWSAVAPGPDGGCFVASGSDYYGGYDDGHVALLDATGAIDPRFASWSNDLEPGSESLVDLAGLADGGALVLRAGEQLEVVRLLPDGSPDPGFGAAGVAALPVPLDCRSTSFCEHGTVAALADGRVLAVVGHYPASVVVLDGAGAPDATYGTSGVAASSGAFRVDAAHVATDGAAWLVGTVIAPERAAVEAVDPTGASALPATEVDALTWSVRAEDLVVDPLGRLVIGGRATDLSGAGAGAPALVRTDPAGVPDPTFGAGGVEQLGGPDALGSNGSVDALDRAGDGTVVGVASGYSATRSVLVFSR